MSEDRKPWHHDTRSRHERGYDSRWVRRRRLVLARDLGLCQPCARLDRPTNATEVDHIVPKEDGGSDRFDNLQSICDACHAVKNAADNRARLGLSPRVLYDAAGWPIWPVEGGGVKLRNPRP